MSKTKSFNHILLEGDCPFVFSFIDRQAPKIQTKLKPIHEKLRHI